MCSFVAPRVDTARGAWPRSPGRCVVTDMTLHPSPRRTPRRCDRKGESALVKKLFLVPAVAALLLAGSASAQNALIDYQGYAWETGGFPPSDPGDILSFVAVADNIDPRFGVN